MIGLVAILSQICMWFLLTLQRQTSLVYKTLYMRILLSHIVRHISNNKQLLNVEFIATNIIRIQPDKKNIRNVHTTMCEHPLLVGYILCIDLHLIFLGTFFIIRSRTALDLIDGITVRRFLEYIDSTIAALESKRGLTNILSTILQALLRLGEH